MAAQTRREERERFMCDQDKNSVSAQYVVIKAEDNGVSIIGMTRGRETRLLHTEKIDKGEVCIMQFTENTSAIKVRGKAKILTEFGEIFSE